MDEFAIQKGHRNATFVVEARRGQVLRDCRGGGREDPRPFSEALGEEGRSRIQAAVMDTREASSEKARRPCPNAEIIYDLFHVVVGYVREVVDRVRVVEAHRLPSDKPARSVVKDSRWLPLRNWENIDPGDRVRLAELFRANLALAAVYVLKDDMKQLWQYKYQTSAQRFSEGWYWRAMRRRIAPLKKFAQNLKWKLDGVLSHCRWPLHKSLLDGINNKIKVIKRMAYGLRHDEYFFLEIRQASSGSL